jgi:hypothetical protein
MLPCFKKMELTMSSIDSLPNEILHHLFTFFTKKEMQPLALVCQLWRNVYFDQIALNYANISVQEVRGFAYGQVKFKWQIDVREKSFIKFLVEAGDTTKAQAMKDETEQEKVKKEKNERFLKQIFNAMRYISLFKDPEGRDHLEKAEICAVRLMQEPYNDKKPAQILGEIYQRRGEAEKEVAIRRRLTEYEVRHKKSSIH